MDQYKQTYEALSAALSFHMAVELARADGKLDFADAPLFIAPMVKVPGAIEGINEVLKELAKMPAAARAELMGKLAAEYDIADDKLEAKIEAGIEWLIATGKFIGTLK